MHCSKTLQSWSTVENRTYLPKSSKWKVRHLSALFRVYRLVSSFAYGFFVTKVLKIHRMGNFSKSNNGSENNLSARGMQHTSPSSSRFRPVKIFQRVSATVAEILNFMAQNYNHTSFRFAGCSGAPLIIPAASYISECFRRTGHFTTRSCTSPG